MPERSMLHPFGVAESLDLAVRLVRRNAAGVLAVAAPFAVVRTVLVTLVVVATESSSNRSTLQLLARPLITSLGLTVLTGLLAPLFAADLVGAPNGVRPALSAARSAVATLLALTAIVSVAEEVGGVALGVGGAWLWGIWAVAAPVATLEQRGPFSSLRRSRELVRGMFWRVWGIRALGWLVTTVLAFLLALPFAALAAYLTGTDPLRVATEGVHDATVYNAVVGLGTLLGSLVVLPVAAAIDLVIYTDLRMRREGMDLEMQLAALPAQADG